MGRGIVESGLFRSERCEFEQRTTDPASFSEGEAWIRTDVAPDTNQLATLRFADGASSTIDIPIYDEAASADSQISKAWTWRINGTTGFIPILENSGTHDKLRLQHNSSWWGAHDSLSALPDSALLHFPFKERSNSTLVEELQGADGTANGLTNVSGTYYDNYAEDGDGTNDYGDLGDWSGVNFGQRLVSDWGILLTVETTDTEGTFLGLTDSNSWELRIELFGTDEIPGLYFRDAAGNSNVHHIKGSSVITDGNKYRLAIGGNGNSASDIVLFVNATDETTIQTNQGSHQDVGNFGRPVYSHAQNNDGSASDYVSATIDNIIPLDSKPTAQVAQDDYDNQPWS